MMIDHDRGRDRDHDYDRDHDHDHGSWIMIMIHDHDHDRNVAFLTQQIVFLMQAGFGCISLYVRIALSLEWISGASSVF